MAPPEDFIKVHCDASLKDEGWIGLGVAGEVLFAVVRCSRGYWSAEIAECKAVLLGVKFARRYGYKRVIIKSDSQVIVSRLSKAATFLSDLDSILNDVLFLSFDFDFLSCLM